MLAGNTDESYTYQFNPYSFQGRCQTQKGWKTSYDPPREDLNETQLAVLTTRMPGFLRAPETAWVSLGGSSRSGMCWDGHRDITDILALPRALASATDDPGRQRYEEALRAWYRLLDEKSPLSAEDVAPRVRQLLASYPELKP